MTESQKLLADYAAHASEAAFRGLVTRYVDLVFSTALRSVGGDAHYAQDITQMVFLDLARQAPRLAPDTMLGGWLHRATCCAAANLVRRERRREHRERQAAEMNALNRGESPLADIGPVLDAAINELPEEDRKAILLRFYERLDLRAVGEALGSSEDAAQKRVSRALEKLELLLKHRGITSTAAALSLALASTAVQTAPIGLAASVATAALAGTAISASTALAATKAIAMTTTSKILIGATIAALAGASLYEAHQAFRWREQHQLLQQQSASLATQMRQLQNERDEATNRLASLAQQLAQLRNNSTELLRLRAEVSQLRQSQTATPQNPDPVESAAREWLRQVNLIKAKFDEWPDKKIPELAFLVDYDWLQSARGADIEHSTEMTLRHMLANLRLSAKRIAACRLGEALQSFIADHQGQLPAQLTELNAYYEKFSEMPAELDPALFDRYQLVQSGNLANLNPNDPIIVEKTPPVDPEYDTQFQLTAYGYRYEGVGKSGDLGPGSGTFRHLDKIQKYLKK